MGREYDAIDQHLRDWIAKQPLFFVATAPAALDGHLNLSPKGPIGMLRVLGPHRIAYLDLVGSGAETLAHVRENGRIVVMLCAFEGPPRIVRLHGGGRAVLSSEPGFDALRAEGDFEPPEHTESQRAIVVVDVSRIADSCGYGVPLMRYEGRRPHMDAWAGKKLRVGGAEAIEDYKRDRNAVSIDGLPAVDPAPAPHA